MNYGAKSDDPNLPNLIDDVVMSEGIKAKVRADCKLSKHILEH